VKDLLIGRTVVLVSLLVTVALIALIVIARERR